MDSLDSLRLEIDELDKQLVEVFIRRMDVVRRVGEAKALSGGEVYDPSREKQVLENAIFHAGAEHADDAAQLMTQVMAISKQRQKKALGKAPQKILVINGPNLNLLGSREVSVYGTQTYNELEDSIKLHARKVGCEIDIKQFNGEGDIIDALHGAIGNYGAVIINPGAYTHYSYAIYDAILAVGLPTVEVHITNIAAREPFRQKTVTGGACIGVISGLGARGYLAAIDYLCERLA